MSITGTCHPSALETSGINADLPYSKNSKQVSSVSQNAALNFSLVACSNSQVQVGTAGQERCTIL